MRKALYFLGVLDDIDVEWFATYGSVRFVEPSTTLITEGLPIEFLFIILDGELSVNTMAGNRRPLAILRSGEIVGEISFVDSRPPTASVVAVLNSHVLAVPHDLLKRKLERDLPFASRFYRAIALYLADRLRTTAGRLGYGTVGQDDLDSELDDGFLDNFSMGAIRFDSLLRQLKTSSS